MGSFADAWGTDGFQVCCLKSIGGNPFEAGLRERGMRVVNLGARNLRDRRAFRRLVRLLREERVELVHSHLTYAAIWGALACRLAGIPLVATLHVGPSRAPRRSREGLREALLCRVLDRWAAAVIAVSRALRDAWLGRGGIDPAKLAVVPNGIDVETFAAAQGRDATRRDVRRELGVDPGAPLVTTVSVLREGKGLEVLLDAAPAILAAHPRARFLIAGDGPLRETLAARARRLGLGEAVLWAGFRRDVPALLAASDLFVLPSLDDAFPTVLLEAMAAGLAVVSTRTGGIPEIVDEPRTCRLVPPGDAPALAAAVADLLDRPADRRSMGEAGQSRVRASFSTAAWAARLERVYAAALAGRDAAVSLRSDGRREEARDEECAVEATP